MYVYSVSYQKIIVILVRGKASFNIFLSYSFSLYNRNINFVSTIFFTSIALKKSYNKSLVKMRRRYSRRSKGPLVFREKINNGFETMFYCSLKLRPELLMETPCMNWIMPNPIISEKNLESLNSYSV